MSKAFTSEETEDDLPRGRPPPRAGESRPITPRGKAALEAELREVQRELAGLRGGAQPEAAVSAQRGEVARTAQRDELARREELLAATLATVHEVAPPSSLETVSFGCKVTVRGEAGKKQRYTLVGPDEADAKQGRISIASPLARALLEQAVGDEVELERPRGVERLEIVKIERG